MKLLRLSLLPALAAFAPAKTFACAACYGANIDAPMADGMNWAILTLGVTVARTANEAYTKASDGRRGRRTLVIPYGCATVHVSTATAIPPQSRPPRLPLASAGRRRPGPPWA